MILLLCMHAIRYANDRDAHTHGCTQAPYKEEGRLQHGLHRRLPGRTLPRLQQQQGFSAMGSVVTHTPRCQGRTLRGVDAETWVSHAPGA